MLVTQAMSRPNQLHAAVGSRWFETEASTGDRVRLPCTRRRCSPQKMFHIYSLKFRPGKSAKNMVGTSNKSVPEMAID